MPNTANPNRSEAAGQIREVPYITAKVTYIDRDGDEHVFQLDTRWTGRQTGALRRFMGVTPEDIAVTEASTRRDTLAMGLDTLIGWALAAGVAKGYNWRQVDVDELLDLAPADLQARIQYEDMDIFDPAADDEGVHDEVADGEDPTVPDTGEQSD